MFALIQNDQVVQFFDVDPKYPAEFEVIDVRSIPGILLGWVRSGDTFRAPQPVAGPCTLPELIAYAQCKQTLVASHAVTVGVGTADQPVNVTASTDAASIALLSTAYLTAQSDISATFDWVQPDNRPVKLTAAQIVTVFSAVTSFLQATMTTLAAVITAINDSSITTAAQVERPPAPMPGWPIP